MTNISKDPLTPEQEQDLFTQMSALFAGKSKPNIQNLLSDLLGHEEQVMLAKRLAIIIMLERKQTAYFIGTTLHVSPATVTRINSLRKAGYYEHITKLCNTKSITVITILEGIDSILHLGGILPHYGHTHKSEAYKKARNG